MSLTRLLLFVLALITLPARAEAPGSAPDSFSAKVLALHNAERTRLGIAPMSWNPQLARQAREWAQYLAARGAFQHSRDTGGAGENLWMGTSGAFPPEAMIGAFIGERKYFRPGHFPQVSRTGRWSDVGHYTQLIWPATRELGCALAQGTGRDVLVCRYFPAGNIIGQRVP
jgi:Cysteine-rich secretory protein family